MITRLYADNYRTLVNFEISFDRLNIVLGTNGAGKTVIFDVIRAIRSFLTEGKRVNEVFPVSSLTRWQKVDVQTFELEVKTEECVYIYHLEIQQNSAEQKCRVIKETVTSGGRAIFAREMERAELYNDEYTKGPEILVDWTLSGVGLVNERKDNKKLYRFKNAVSQILVCAPDPNLMKDVPEEDEVIPDYHFSNLATVYNKFILNHPDKIPELWNYLKEIHPEYNKIYFSAKPADNRLIVACRTKESEFSFYFSELSNGEKMIFALYLLVVCFGTADFSLFLDEPDNFVSLREIQPWLQIVEDAAGKSQCIIVSHNSEVIDYLAQSPYGKWLSRTAYGATRVAAPPAAGGKGITYSELIARGDTDD